MYRYFLVVILSALIIGCGQQEDAEPQQVTIAKNQATKAIWEKQLAEKNAAIAQANQKAAEEKAAIENSQSHTLIFGLSIGAFLAFFLGVGLGSSSKKQATKVSSE